MKPTSFVPKLLAAAVLLQTCLASAQENGPRPLTPSPAPSASAFLIRDLTHGTQVNVVTIAEPTLRKSCLVGTYIDETIVCTDKAGKPTATWKQSDLVAILKDQQRENHFSLKRFLAEFGFGGGAIAGAAFLASVSTIAAIPIAVIGGIYLMVSTVEAFEAMDQGARERVAYLNPTQQLQIALK
jgi:hypothetical protein